MKASLITEEQIKAIEDALETMCKSDSGWLDGIEALTIVRSLKVQEPVALIAFIHPDHFNDVCDKANGNSSTPLYAGEQP